MKNFFVLSTLLFLFGCSQPSVNDLEETNNSSEEIDEEPVKQDDKDNGPDPEKVTEIDFKRFFKPTNSTATFIGDGNEYASFTERTTYLDDQYVATIIDNGGATILKIYRIGGDEIDIVMDEPIDGMNEEEVFPTIEALNELPVIETFLAGPIEVGTKFGNWSIIETDIELVTPYQTFDHVLVIEESGEGFKNKKYIAEDYGVIKTEAIMSVDSSEEVTVTSTLEDISLH